jgi:hypothetical protein
VGLLADEKRLDAAAGGADAPVKPDPVADDHELCGFSHFLLAQPEPGRETTEAVGVRDVRQNSVSDSFRGLVRNVIVSRPLLWPSRVVLTRSHATSQSVRRVPHVGSPVSLEGSDIGSSSGQGTVGSSDPRRWRSKDRRISTSSMCSGGAAAQADQVIE